MASKLIRRSPCEAEDALETLLVQLTPPYQLILHTPQEYARLMQALLYAILTQPQSGQTHVTHLKAIVTDGYASLVHLLIRLVNESYPKLVEQTKLQVIWVFRQLVELCASDSETLCLALLRRIAGGDLSQGNVWLALELLHVLHSNWGWVIAKPGLVTGALFTYPPESETLIPDLVRFICCAHHPPNEILQSDVISRWAIVGWLLKCCRSKHVEANAKLALFYDWLFFTDKIDNLMNIEPAILLMVHSIPKYIDMKEGGSNHNSF